MNQRDRKTGIRETERQKKLRYRKTVRQKDKKKDRKTEKI
jgi:hypothetical protein